MTATVMIVPGRIGPTVCDPSYGLVLQPEVVLRAQWDVQTWVDRVHAIAIALQPPRQHAKATL